MADKSIDFLTNDLTIIVYNFIDMLSHARTEVEVIKELAKDERAYRSLTKSWFQNSVLYETLQAMAERDIQLFITTDHGTIRVNTPVKVVGDRETTLQSLPKILLGHLPTWWRFFRRNHLPLCGSRIKVIQSTFVV